MKKKFVNYGKTLLQHNLKIMIIAMILDAIGGDPKFLYSKIPHPTSWIGKLIHFLEFHLNKSSDSPIIQKRKGCYTFFLTLWISSVTGLCLQKALFRLFSPPIATFLAGMIGSIFVAQRSLYQHVNAVQKELEKHDLPQARHAVSQIVGRETKDLDSSAICRAAIESLAENFSDGVIAPIFWGCIAGLPGIIIYKSINTADSMIGHLTRRYQHFGYVAAKSDDYANYFPARLSALYILLTQNKLTLDFLKKNYQDAQKHNSPNAGWPEAAMAHCLGIQLAGPRRYKEQAVNIPYIGNGRQILDSKDIQQACRIFHQSCVIKCLFLILLYIFNEIKGSIST